MVETLIAITILSTAVVGTMTIAFQGLRGAQLARDQLTASYLAQEAIDFIRAKRDENYLSRLPSGYSAPNNPGMWDTGLDACITGNCTIDVTLPTNAPVSCGGTCPVLLFQESSGRYGYQSGWTATRFTRTIHLSSNSPDVYQLVTVTMSWQTGSVARSLVLEESMMNWHSGI